MDFAVVYFINDKSYSEIPSNWLSIDKKTCYWPKSKNPMPLMKQMADPDNTWDEFEVIVECFSRSLEEARKKAERKESCSESNSECRGRGKRKRIPLRRSSSLSSYSEESNFPPFPSNFKEIPRENDVNNCTKSTSNGGISNAGPSNEGTSNEGVCDIDDYTATDITPTVLQPIQANILNTEHDDTNNDVENVVDIGLVEDISDALSSKLDEIMKVSLKCLNYCKSIDKRLNTLENKAVQEREQISKLNERFPLKTIADILDFENQLSTDDFLLSYVNHIQAIGGNSVKDNASRILKIIFTDELAMKCSWMGQRGNFKLSSLKMIVNIVDAMFVTNGGTRKEGEKCISEWFRLAKLRFDRRSHQ